MRVLLRNGTDKSIAVTEACDVAYVETSKELRIFGVDGMSLYKIYSMESNTADAIIRDLFQRGMVDISYLDAFYEGDDNDDEEDDASAVNADVNARLSRMQLH